MSPAVLKVVVIEAVEAEVNRPWASTVITGIAVVLPYDPADTAVLSRLIVAVPEVTTEDSPVPPAIVSDSEPSSILSVPVSPAMSRSLLAATVVSTYAFVAASCALEGSVTLTIRDVLTSTTPAPLGSKTTLPFVSVELIVLPSIVILSMFSTSILLEASTKRADDAVRVPGV